MTDIEWIQDFASHFAESNEVRLQRAGRSGWWIAKPNLARRKLMAEVIAAGLALATEKST